MNDFKKEIRKVSNELYPLIIHELKNNGIEFIRPDTDYYGTYLVIPKLELYLRNINEDAYNSSILSLKRNLEFSKYEVFKKRAVDGSMIVNFKYDELELEFSFFKGYKIAKLIRKFLMKRHYDKLHKKDKDNLEAIQNYVKSNKSINRSKNISKILD